MTVKDAARYAISKDTLVPVGFVVLVASCVWWASGADYAIKAAEKTNGQQDTVLMELTKNQTRLTAIVERLEERTRRGGRIH